MLKTHEVRICFFLIGQDKSKFTHCVVLPARLRYNYLYHNDDDDDDDDDDNTNNDDDDDDDDDSNHNNNDNNND